MSKKWSGSVVVCHLERMRSQYERGVVYILRGWSVVRLMASVTDMDSHTGDYSRPSREYKADGSELRKELYEDLSLSTASHSL